MPSLRARGRVAVKRRPLTPRARLNAVTAVPVATPTTAARNNISTSAAAEGGAAAAACLVSSLGLVCRSGVVACLLGGATNESLDAAISSSRPYTYRLIVPFAPHER